MSRRRIDFGWGDAERALAEGVHPDVVAARLGEPIDYLLKVADEQGWPIRWHHALPSPDEMLERYARTYGLDS